MEPRQLGEAVNVDQSSLDAAEKLPAGFDDFDASNMDIMVDKNHFSANLAYEIAKSKKSQLTREQKELEYEKSMKTEAEKAADAEFARRLS
jgi:hypothetical protein